MEAKRFVAVKYGLSGVDLGGASRWREGSLGESFEKLEKLIEKFMILSGKFQDCFRCF
jgi:hypothetical protein